MADALICWCKTGFFKNQDYIDHIRQCSFLKILEGEIECGICSKRISSIKYFRTTHVNFHEEVKQLACDECTARFAVHADLIAHKKRRHSMHKQVQCQNCGMLFATTSERASHMRIHVTEKKFCCQTCGKRFNRSSILKQHLRTHTGERPFTCSTCSKSFTQASSLQKHKKLHRQ